MDERIGRVGYSGPEGQKFQEEPHVTIFQSQESPEKWRVDLRWEDDGPSTANDMQHNFADGLSFDAAIVEAKKFGYLLNVPVAKYEYHSIQILLRPDRLSNKKQVNALQALKRDEKTQRFPTH